MLCEGVVVVCVYWGVLSYKYKYIYFALQKNNKKNKHEINDSRGMLFSLQAGCLFFFLQHKHLHKQGRARAHTHAHRFTETRPFERLAANGLRVPDPGATKMLGCHREAVTLPHTGVTRGPEAGSTNALVGGPLVRKVTRLCVVASVGFCVSVCVCR